MSARSLIQFDNTKDLGKWYDQKYAEMGGGWSMMQQTADGIFEFIGITAHDGAKLLDVGCGGGDFAYFAKQKGFNVSATDCSQLIINTAQEKYSGIAFNHGDIEVYKFFEKFDIITSVGSVEHCIHIDVALKNIRTHLKDGGVFYALVPNEEWIHMDQPQEQTHTDEEWKEIFIQAGFITVKQKRNRDLSEFLLK